MAHELGKPGRAQRQTNLIKPKQAPAGQGLSESQQLQRRLGNETIGALVGEPSTAAKNDQIATDSLAAIVNRPVGQQGQSQQIRRQGKTAPAGIVQRLANNKTLESDIGEIGLNPLKNKIYRDLLRGLAEYHALPPLVESGATQQRLEKLAKLKQQAIALLHQQIEKAETKSGQAKETARQKPFRMNEFLRTLVFEQHVGQLLIKYQNQPEVKPTLLSILKTWLDQETLPQKDKEAGELFYLRLKSGDQDLIHNAAGVIPADQPDYRDDNNDKPVDRYVVTLAVAQKNADWLKNVEMLRNQVIKKAITSPHQLIKKVQAGEFEEYASEAVLKKQPDWADKDEAQQQELLDQFTDGIHQVGHTWLRLAAYSGSELKELYSYGFWPQKFYNPESDDLEGGYAGFTTPGPGLVQHPDTEHEKDANKMYYDYPVQEAQFQRVLAMAQERQQNPPPYVLTDYNCTKFVRELLGAVGLAFPGKGLLPGHIFTPGKVYQALSKMMKKGDEQAYTKDPLEAIVAGVNQQTEKRADQAQLNARLATNDLNFAQPNRNANRIPQVLYPRTIRFGVRPDQIDQTLEINEKQKINFINDEAFIDYWQVEREGPNFQIVPLEVNDRLIYAQAQDYNDSKYGRPKRGAPRKQVTLHKGHVLNWGKQPDKFDLIDELANDFKTKQLIDPEFEKHWGNRGGVPIKSGGEISFIKQTDFTAALKPKATVDVSAYPIGRHKLNVDKATQLQGTHDGSFKGGWEDVNVEAGEHQIVFHEQVLQTGHAVFFLNGKGSPYYIPLADLQKLGYAPQSKKEKAVDVSAYPIGRHKLNVDKATQLQGTHDGSFKGGWEDVNVEAGEHQIVFHEQVLQTGHAVFFLNGKGSPYYIPLADLPKLGYAPQSKKEKAVDVSAYPIGRHKLNVDQATQLQGTHDGSFKGGWEDVNVEAGEHQIVFHEQVLQTGHAVFFLNGKGSPYYIPLADLQKLGYAPQSKKEKAVDVSAYPIGRHKLNVDKATQLQGTHDGSFKGGWEDVNVEAGEHQIVFHEQVLQTGHAVFFLNGKGSPYYIPLADLQKIGL